MIGLWTLKKIKVLGKYANLILNHHNLFCQEAFSKGGHMAEELAAKSNRAIKKTIKKNGVTKKTPQSKAKKTAQKRTGKATVARSKSVKKQSNFKQHALVYNGPPLPVTMDSTAHIEISCMLNEKFSKELFDEADKLYDLEKLTKYSKRKTKKVYYNEGKKQVLELWRKMESFAAHSDLFQTSFLIAIGSVLNHIENNIGKKSEYMKWMKENFKHKHFRYFQQAKQLDKMGAFARNYASLGKNRLLELERIRKELDLSIYELFTRFPFQDTTADQDGSLFKEHADGVVTYHRMRNAGIDFIEFDQAALIGAQLKSAVTKKMATSIFNWLETTENKLQALDDLILNKMVFPDREPTRTVLRKSIRKHLADLVNYSDTLNFENDEWVSSIQEYVSQNELKRAYDFIVIIAEKLNISLNGDDEQEDARRVA